MDFPHYSSVDSADVAKTPVAFSAYTARGGRAGQSGEDLVRVVSETVQLDHVSCFIAA
jgi:hypothetical protein